MLNNLKNILKQSWLKMLQWGINKHKANEKSQRRNRKSQQVNRTYKEKPKGNFWTENTVNEIKSWTDWLSSRKERRDERSSDFEYRTV